MKKRLVFLLNTVFLVALLFSVKFTVNVTAAATEYDLWVAGTQVTSDTLSGTGWKFEPDTNTLVLNDFNYGSGGYGYRIKYDSDTKTDIYAFIYVKSGIPAQKQMIFAENGRYIVLFGLQDPGNVGMMIRTADALGLDGVILSGSCDLYSPKVIRSTMGSVFRVNIMIENDAEKLFEMLHSSGAETSAAVIDKDAVPVTDLCFEGRQAVLIGNEGNGLPREISNACTRRITIPMHGNVNSLNAAMAAGILMWELKK